MKEIIPILFAGCVLLYSIPLFVTAQEITPSSVEEQLENFTEANEAETEDDSRLQLLAALKNDPVNLNTATSEELQQLQVFTGLQIASFLWYRRLLGKFVNIYELQAIPAWDIITIKKILPFVTLDDPVDVSENWRRRFHNGRHSFLFRFAQTLEKSTGYTTRATGNYYLGSPQKLFFRYRYQYKNWLQYGILGDKDAGEPFFRGRQRYGFDFYSFHLFIRKTAIIQSLAIGDFTVNLGQGLIQWQSLAFGKGVEISGIKRQSPILRPYNSAGEYNFHRGIGITIRKGNIETTAFASARRISANLITDTVSTGIFVSSFLTSGFNRTAGELDDRNSLRQMVIGGNISWTLNSFHVGLNGISYTFSLPIQKRPEPYNLFAVNGKNWNNVSIDYSYTYHNFHFFGEVAADKNSHQATVDGLLISVDPKVDLSFLYRSISSRYQALNGNAFTENSNPGNENGFYAGCSIRPHQAIRLDAYADIFKFPWLKYQVDAPSYGKELFSQLTYSPNKQVEIYTRYRNGSRQLNRGEANAVMNSLALIPKQDWRTQINYQLHRGISIRSRFELVWYDRNSKNRSSGFLGLFDCIIKPAMKPYSVAVRLQFFETGDYNSRLYAYENDVLFSYSIPVFFDKGYRYYLNLNYQPNKRLNFWLKWAQTIYNDKTSIGSGLDEINGNSKSELRFQFALYL